MILYQNYCYMLVGLMLTVFAIITAYRITPIYPDEKLKLCIWKDTMLILLYGIMYSVGEFRWIMHERYRIGIYNIHDDVIWMLTEGIVFIVFLRALIRIGRSGKWGDSTIRCDMCGKK